MKYNIDYLQGRCDNRLRTPKEDDYGIATNYHNLPIGIVFYWNTDTDSRPYQKVSKTMCWDGKDKAWATKPSWQHFIVRLDRRTYINYGLNRKQGFHNTDQKELLELALQHQYK
jgi:hypothetical protein